MSTEALTWITGDDTGISSTAIWARMMGAPQSGRYAFGNYPHDPDDFGRCYRLLASIPEWRPRIGEMAAEGEVWARLAAAWDELSALYEEEARTFGVDPAARQFGWRAPRLYARLKELGA